MTYVGLMHWHNVLIFDKTDNKTSSSIEYHL